MYIEVMGWGEIEKIQPNESVKFENPLIYEPSVF